MNTTTKQDWAILPYNVERISGHYLVSNFLGNWSVLTLEEFKLLDQLRIEEDKELFERLLREGIVVSEQSVMEHIETFRRLNANLFWDVSLHIPVLTTRCNIACKYCQTHVDNPEDMSEKVAQRVLEYTLNTHNPKIHLEFQGGEALLNWKVLRSMIQTVQEYKAKYPNKKVMMSIVSNGILLKDDKMEFLVDNDVNICMSLDGPKDLHDKSRAFSKGEGSYEYVKDGIQRLKQLYERKGLSHRPINLLLTVNQNNIKAIKDVVDEYVHWGVREIALRPINKLGSAAKGWNDLGVTPKEFIECWTEAMDYLLNLNKKGVIIKERMATVLLTKLLAKQDPGYVDIMNPAGAGRAVLTYMPNGDIYPGDEARMIGDDFFKLGNVFEDSYEEVMKSPKMFSICQSSVLELYDYNSFYLPWSGTDPILNYKLQGSLIPKITQTPLYKISRRQFRYLLEKIITSQEDRDIFSKWIIKEESRCQGESSLKRN